jgi:chromosomal replication initiator protein
MTHHGRSPSRKGSLAKNRTAAPGGHAIYLLRKEIGASLPQIGELLGGPGHTTVMSAIEKIANDIESKTDPRKRIANVKQQLYGQTTAI